MIKTLDMLRLIAVARAEKHALESRHSQWGIAVRKDSGSLRWQRIDRQERKLELRLKERLGYRPNQPLCALCYWGESICRCEHSFPHIPDTPAMLIEELILDTACVDFYDLIGLFHALLDGTCLACGRDVGGTHLICADCAGNEAQQWAGWGGMLKIGDLRL